MSRLKSAYILGSQQAHEAFEQQLCAQYRRCTEQEMERRRAQAQAKPIRSDDFSVELLTNMPPWLAPILSTLLIDRNVFYSSAESLIDAVWLVSLRAHRAAAVSISADDLLPLLANEVDQWFAPLLSEMNPQELNDFVESVLAASIRASDRTAEVVVNESDGDRRQRYDNSYGLVSCYTMFINQMQRCLPAPYRHMARMLQDKFHAMLREYDINQRMTRIQADIDCYKQLLRASVVKIEAMKCQETQLNRKHDDVRASVESLDKRLASTDRERSNIPVWMDPVAIVHKIFDLQKRQSEVLSLRLQQQIEEHAVDLEKQKLVLADICNQLVRNEQLLQDDKTRLDAVTANLSAANELIQREVSEWQRCQPAQLVGQSVTNANPFEKIVSNALLLGESGLSWIKHLVGTLAVGRSLAACNPPAVEMTAMGVSASQVDSSRPVSPSDVQLIIDDELEGATASAQPKVVSL